MRAFRSIVVVAALACAARAASAQEVSQPPADAPRVFLDCSYFCDDNFVRTELNWVNWVRDRADAQVHLLITRQQTGGGGSEFSLTFIGQEDLVRRTDTLAYTSPPTASQDDQRQGLLRVMQAGLMPFTLATSVGPRLQVTMGAPADTAAGAAVDAPARDPWNYWVFTLSARSNIDGEESQRFGSYRGNVSANRTTDAFKIRIGANANYNESEFDLTDADSTERTIRSIRKGYDLNVLAVKSLGAHWSAGVQSGATSGTFGNISLGLNGGPAVEYSLWPYAESNRRSLVARYSVGVRSFDYREVTIFDRTAETHPFHSLDLELDLRQPWGSISFSTDLSQYLHDAQKYSVGFFGNANISLFKGFSLDFFGNYDLIRDQLSLSKAELTDAEVLLRQRQLETSYRYFAGFGIRYSFGSIFNNVVNPRFGEGGGGGIIFF
ncbi:MAG: hypothetical protein ACREKM_03315 [Longimicrobiales bacterium]